MSRAISASLKKNERHTCGRGNEIRRTRLSPSDVYMGTISQSNRQLATPHFKPTISIKRIEQAVDWVATERERLLKTRRATHDKKK